MRASGWRCEGDGLRRIEERENTVITVESMSMSVCFSSTSFILKGVVSWEEARPNFIEQGLFDGKSFPPPLVSSPSSSSPASRLPLYPAKPSYPAKTFMNTRTCVMSNSE